MQVNGFLLVLGLLFTAGCNSPRAGLFGSRTPHEKYRAKITEAGLNTTALGTAWLSAAEKSLSSPAVISIPYRETGYFDPAVPGSNGYRFQARNGERIVIELEKKPVTGFAIFLELWQAKENKELTLLESVDTSLIKYEMKSDGDYHLRLQPELLAGGEYTLIIRSEPSLAFPVRSENKPRIGSFWGDARDAGGRSHEGVDIFGALRTPVVAAYDGHIRSVGLNNLGGKVIFLKPDGKPYSLYYAHLDSQLVTQGQRVQAGEVIGLMGKTGNARNTPVHLHFGIYTGGGAVDPLPFIDPAVKEVPGLKLPLDLLNTEVRTREATPVLAFPQKKDLLMAAPASTLLKVTGATGDRYKIKLPDDREGYVDGAAVTGLKALRTIPAAGETRIRDRPDSLAATKIIVGAGTKMEILAQFNEYYFVNAGKKQGWIRK